MFIFVPHRSSASDGLEVQTLAEICSIRECDHLSGSKWAECILSCHESPGLSDLDLEEEEEDSAEKKVADDASVTATVSPLRRQVDPLQSCIETRCAGRRGSYAQCILNRCLLELGLGSRFDSHTRALPANSAIAQARSSEALKNAFNKRGYNDITDVCIAYYCPRETPGTFGYLTCVASNRCRGR
jgi:hypothetical protein